LIWRRRRAFYNEGWAQRELKVSRIEIVKAELGGVAVRFMTQRPERQLCLVKVMSEEDTLTGRCFQVSITNPKFK
jgi:hypothetical protein